MFEFNSYIHHEREVHVTKCKLRGGGGRYEAEWMFWRPQTSWDGPEVLHGPRIPQAILRPCNKLTIP